MPVSTDRSSALPPHRLRGGQLRARRHPMWVISAAAIHAVVVMNRCVRTVHVSALILTVAIVAPLATVVSLAQAPQTAIAPRPSSEQQTRETPTFRLSSRYIEVDAVVKDNDGRFVPDLTADDFVVYEDGRQQTIDQVTMIDLPPIVAGGSEQFVAAVQARPNDEFTHAERIYVMVLESGPAESVKRAAKRIITDFLGPRD